MLPHAEVCFHSPNARGQRWAFKGFCLDVIFTSAHVLLAKESHMATPNFNGVGKKNSTMNLEGGNLKCF